MDIDIVLIEGACISYLPIIAMEIVEVLGRVTRSKCDKKYICCDIGDGSCWQSPKYTSIVCIFFSCARLDEARRTFLARECIDIASRRIRSESDILLESSFEDRGDHLDVVFIAFFFLHDTREYEYIPKSRYIRLFCDLLIKFG